MKKYILLILAILIVDIIFSQDIPLKNEDKLIKIDPSLIQDYRVEKAICNPGDSIPIQEGDRYFKMNGLFYFDLTTEIEKGLVYDEKNKSISEVGVYFVKESDKFSWLTICVFSSFLFGVLSRISRQKNSREESFTPTFVAFLSILSLLGSFFASFSIDFISMGLLSILCCIFTIFCMPVIYKNETPSIVYKIHHVLMGVLFVLIYV